MNNCNLDQIAKQKKNDLFFSEWILWTREESERELQMIIRLIWSNTHCHQSLIKPGTLNIATYCMLAWLLIL